MSEEHAVAIVTGGGRSIGKCIALRLAQEGMEIVLAGREKEPLVATAKEIQQRGRRALAVVKK